MSDDYNRRLRAIASRKDRFNIPRDLWKKETGDSTGSNNSGS